jgi:hypothetical protein
MNLKHKLINSYDFNNNALLRDKKTLIRLEKKKKGNLLIKKKRNGIQK